MQKGYWNADRWNDDVLEWQQDTIRNTQPINFERARRAVSKLYNQMRIEPPNPANWFIVENPVVAGAMYFYLLGGSKNNAMSPGIEIFYRRHEKQFAQLKKLSKDKLKSLVPLLTVANLGAAWGPDVVDEKVKVPHNADGRYIFNEMGFNKEGESYPNERSMETRSMDFVVPWLVKHRDVLANGSYEVVGQRKVQVEGFGGISADVQQELFMDLGQWQFIGNNFMHLKRNGYSHPWVDAFVDLYKECSAWIATESYVLLVDRPYMVQLDGPRGVTHNPKGPAIAWDGYEQYFLENNPVPPEWIEQGIQYDEIMREQNGEIRNIMLRHYGFHNYIRDSGAELLDSDEFNGLPYELYKTQSPGRELIHLLKVRDASHMEFNPETGQIERKIYAIPVSNRATTCAEARADLARTSPEKYKLVYET